MRINLGCGTDIRSGYVNADIARLPGVDVVLDLSAGFLPFASECADEVLCLSVIEHVVPLVPLLRDIHRVLKAGGRAIFEVPHFTSASMFEDPTHRNFFASATFSFFTNDSPRPYYFDFSFSRVERLALGFPRRRAFMLNRPIAKAVNASPWFRGLYESSGLRSLFPADTIEAVLVK
ncbi:MAG TPA: methyltransferase domain-containing protein [Candidatus Binataceae bacterium]|nr:methyltransferase domain-containing protein [Candidatus Binataceae bacterium]